MEVNKVSLNTDYQCPLERWGEKGNRACVKDLCQHEGYFPL